MPAPRYTNRDLARFQRKPLGIRVEEDPRATATPGFTDEPSADQLLAEARGSLGRADALGRENDTRSLLSIPGRLASLSLRNERPSMLRQGTDVLDTAAGVTGTAALPLAFTPGMQPLAAGLGAVAMVEAAKFLCVSNTISLRYARVNNVPDVGLLFQRITKLSPF